MTVANNESFVPSSSILQGGVLATFDVVGKQFKAWITTKASSKDFSVSEFKGT